MNELGGPSGEGKNGQVDDEVISWAGRGRDENNDGDDPVEEELFRLVSR